MIRRLTLCLCFVFASANALTASSPIVTTIAGGVNGKTAWEASGFEGDGGPATESALDQPYGLSVDSEGNLFIADQQNHRIRKIDTDGNISTIAGIGLGWPDFEGDDGPAVGARLFGPTDVFAHSSGEIYIADWGNNRIRKIDTSGVIRTVAGGGTNPPSDGGSALEAFFTPYCVAVDNDGTIYIGTRPGYDDDAPYHQILRVDTEGSITVFAGTTSGTSVKTYAGFDGDGGPATDALLNEPYDVAVGPDGSVYIADNKNHRVRLVDTDGVITTFAGSGDAGKTKYGTHFSGDGGPATEAVLNQVRALAVSDKGTVYIADSNNYCVRAVGADGIINTVAGEVLDGWGSTTDGFTGDGGPATDALFGQPYGLALDSSGNLYISTSNERIRMVEALESVANDNDDGDVNGSDGDDSQSDIVVLPSGKVGPIGLDLDTAFGDQGLRQTPENPGAGDKIEVEVFITEGGRGESGFLVEFAWDPMKLTFSGFSTQDVFSGAITLETPEEGSMTLSNVFLGFGAIKDSGSLGVATFEVAETFSGAATITLSSAKLGIHRPDNDLLIGPGASYVVIGGNEEVSLTPQQASDFDGDGTVGFGDFLQFASGFGAGEGDANYDPRLDLDKDGSVGFNDFLTFAGLFGQTVE